MRYLSVTRESVMVSRAWGGSGDMQALWRDRLQQAVKLAQAAVQRQGD